MSLSAYLGRPGNTFGMQPIPTPEPGGTVGSRGVATAVSRGTITQALISGGATTQRLAKTKRGYSVEWSLLLPSETDLLLSFFDGRQGGGPYCLIDPSWGNQLPANVAGMGAVLGAVPEWSPTVGAVATSTSAGPTGLLSGVMAWTGAGNGSILYTGLNNVVDGTWLPPFIPGLSCRASIWAKLASGSGTLTAATMYGIAGAAPAGTAATGTGVVLSSTWQEVPVGVASSFTNASANYFMPKFTVSSSSSPSILLSAPAFVYSDAATAPALSPWVSGLGVPRVVVTGDVPTPVDLVGWREWSMTLQEA